MAPQESMQALRELLSLGALSALDETRLIQCGAFSLELH
ncbi:hypothetical protein NIES2104_31600 [Leptolyngbya sp. NIES-2104]|nr:hypothetical protein NIES2104_31600 [Leptolyngbya sp. NIES-2104]